VGRRSGRSAFRRNDGHFFKKKSASISNFAERSPSILVQLLFMRSSAIRGRSSRKREREETSDAHFKSGGATASDAQCTSCRGIGRKMESV